MNLTISQENKKIQILGNKQEVVIDLPNLQSGFEILELVGTTIKEVAPQLHRVLSKLGLHLVIKHKGYEIARIDSQQPTSFLSRLLGITPINLKPFQVLLSILSFR